MKSKRSFVALALLAAAVNGRCADSVVYFANDVFRLPDGSLDAARLVVFGNGFSSEVRNDPVQTLPNYGPSGGADGVSPTGTFVAQLFQYMPANASWRGLGDAVPIGPPGSLPGTWEGRMVSLPGVAPGETTALKVKVWDPGFISHEAAMASPFGFAGSSQAFSYSQPTSVQSPDDLYMFGFTGVVILGSVPEPSLLGLASLGIAVLVALRLTGRICLLRPFRAEIDRKDT